MNKSKTMVEEFCTDKKNKELFEQEKLILDTTEALLGMRNQMSRNEWERFKNDLLKTIIDTPYMAM